MLLLYLGALVLVTTVFCELAATRGWLPYWVSRKILHIIAVGACAVAGYYADSLGYRELLIWIVAGAEVLLLGLIGFGGLMREESGRKPWGIVWFPLAFLVLLLVVQEEAMIGFCMAVLAVCDPAATIAGKLLAKPVNNSKADIIDGPPVSSGKAKFPAWAKPYSLTGDPKTLIGNLAFLASFLFLCLAIPNPFSFVVYPPLSGPPAEAGLVELLGWPSVIGCGIFLAATEALGSKGTDNLCIPLGCALLLSLYSKDITDYTLPIIILAAVVFFFLTIRRRSLSPGGAVTASLLGILVTLSAGPQWLIPLILFFGSSSLIGKLFPSRSAAGDAKQKQPRDAAQVLANGTVYTAVAVFLYQDWDSDILYLLKIPWEFYLLTAAAVATADTWSSEIGQYSNRPTWDLVNWRRVPAGLSGGVSWPGTLAGLAGATFIALTGYLLLPEYLMVKAPLVIIFGFGGMLLDSVLGSLLQATYRNPENDALSDVCPPNGKLTSGFRWMTNDLVNFLAILITTIIAAFVLPP